MTENLQSTPPAAAPEDKALAEARCSEPMLDAMLMWLRDEVKRACTKHASMHSPHEGYAVIQEEVDELWELVKKDKGRTGDARDEALQIAAMGIRYCMDMAQNS